MPDIYVNIASADEKVVERLVTVLELRAADARQREMRESYFSEITFTRSRVLEVGCGTGAVTRALAAWPGVAEAVGLDPSPRFIEAARLAARDLKNLSFEKGNGYALPFGDATFDVVVFHTTLCHIPQPERALAEARRVVRSNGWVAVFDGDYVTTTVANNSADPLEACAKAAIAALVHDPWFVRKMTQILRATGFVPGSVRSHGFLETADPEYMLTIVDRGADALVAAESIDAETAAALKAEARRRVGNGAFFGFISYASVIARPGALSI